MFERENEFYEENKDNLRKEYLGKEVVIVKDKVIAAHDDVGTAIRETVKTRPLGSFCAKNIPVNSEEKMIRIPTFLVTYSNSFRSVCGKNNAAV
jgi:hypothetical protein